MINKSYTMDEIHDILTQTFKMHALIAVHDDVGKDGEVSLNLTYTSRNGPVPCCSGLAEYGVRKWNKEIDDSDFCDDNFLS